MASLTGRQRSRPMIKITILLLTASILLIAINTTALYQLSSPLSNPPHPFRPAVSPHQLNSTG
ncbi:hypothetical protein C5167_011630 [Papaver somniferum]|uniref:Uncharacterized protein n=1 Tax=Papaver somniferum TaxID=3469 RepID=A0A4Y7K3J8_PAPSO|nr:hypothetical protein C5167_011630 [Papaver somniferum]